MKSKERYKKLVAMNDSDLQKEIFKLQSETMIKKIDIANQKYKGFNKISENRHDIARIKTILTGRLLAKVEEITKEKNG
ncbi:MAG: 50S ribosomal protein L29 [Candidatus Berkelbacteria bacterium]|nr:50S ribosomal protein L29 [Candidatus Berkelbacteria bacterium]